MYQAVDTLFRKAVPVSGNGEPRPATIRSAPVRGRRKDDATFIAIGCLLALYFAVQVGWTVLRHAHI
jgi:hypothetical protein